MAKKKKVDDSHLDDPWHWTAIVARAVSGGIAGVFAAGVVYYFTGLYAALLMMIPCGLIAAVIAVVGGPRVFGE